MADFVPKKTGEGKENKDGDKPDTNDKTGGRDKGPKIIDNNIKDRVLQLKRMREAGEVDTLGSTDENPVEDGSTKLVRRKLHETDDTHIDALGAAGGHKGAKEGDNDPTESGNPYDLRRRGGRPEEDTTGIGNKTVPVTSCATGGAGVPESALTTHTVNPELTVPSRYGATGAVGIDGSAMESSEDGPELETEVRDHSREAETLDRYEDMDVDEDIIEEKEDTDHDCHSFGESMMGNASNREPGTERDIGGKNITVMQRGINPREQPQIAGTHGKIETGQGAGYITILVCCTISMAFLAVLLFPIIQIVRNRQVDMSRPIQLIAISPDGKLYFRYEVAEKLQSKQGKVHVVSCIGKYRSGKSYMMSRLNDNVKSFKVGSTLSAETKGVWIMIKQHPEHPSDVIILIDTEGLDDVIDGNIDKDKKISAMVLLSSSSVIYNVKETIGASNIRDLHSVIQLAEKWISHGKNKAALTPPNLAIVIQNRRLEMADAEGNPMTSLDYLEYILSPSSDESYNKIKKTIKTMFRTKSLYTFPTPIDDLGVLGKLADINETNLKPEYVEQFARFKDYMLTSTLPFGVYDRDYNMTGWLKHVQYLVESQDDLPVMSSTSYDKTLGMKSGASEKAIKQLRAKLDEIEKKIPLDENDMKENIKKVKSHEAYEDVKDVINWEISELKVKNKDELQKKLDQQAKERSIWPWVLSAVIGIVCLLLLLVYCCSR